MNHILFLLVTVLAISQLQRNKNTQDSHMDNRKLRIEYLRRGTSGRRALWYEVPHDSDPDLHEP
jgi:hypothetical protein